MNPSYWYESKQTDTGERVTDVMLVVTACLWGDDVKFILHRNLFLSLSGSHGDQPPWDGHNHQCAPPQLHEVPPGTEVGTGAGFGVHCQSHLLHQTWGWTTSHPKIGEHRALGLTTSLLRTGPNHQRPWWACIRGPSSVRYCSTIIQLNFICMALSKEACLKDALQSIRKDLKKGRNIYIYTGTSALSHKSPNNKRLWGVPKKSWEEPGQGLMPVLHWPNRLTFN